MDVWPKIMNVIGAGGGNHDDLVTLCMNDWLLNFCWQESELMFEHCVLCTINFPLPFPVPMPINIKSSKLNPIEPLFHVEIDLQMSRSIKNLCMSTKSNS